MKYLRRWLLASSGQRQSANFGVPGHGYHFYALAVVNNYMQLLLSLRGYQ